MRIFCLVNLLVFCFLLPAGLLGDGLQVDLTKRGYRAPPGQYRKGDETDGALNAATISRRLDFDPENNAVVGFVVRRPLNQLSTSDHAALTWHALKFDQMGQYLSDTSVSTRGWVDNEIFVGDEGTILLRTADELTLFSADGRIVGRRTLPGQPNSAYYALRNRIQVLPKRGAFALSSVGATEIEFLDMRTLATVSRCANSSGVVPDSLSDSSMLTSSPSPPGDASAVRVRVNQKCGPLKYAFNVEGKHGGFNSLLNDHAVVSLGYVPRVAVYVEGIERWQDPFKGHDFPELGLIRADAEGKVFAVLVKTLGGGSRILDLGARLKAARIIVYRASDGKRLAEVPIALLPVAAFDFALSGDGTRLGVLCDGELRILSISNL
jgi:hypothetical protein